MVKVSSVVYFAASSPEAKCGRSRARVRCVDQHGDEAVCNWTVGERDANWAQAFILDLASRLTHRIQLTTDGLHAYVRAVETGFGGDVDYGQLVKMYGPAPDADHPPRPPTRFKSDAGKHGQRH